MQLNGRIHSLPKQAKWFLFFFVLTLTFGYVAGYDYILHTSGVTPGGVEEQYLGNEEDENAEELKFKKPEKEILTIIHTHALSLSLVFLALGAIVLLTSLPGWLKGFLVIEPFVSVILTFGGIWLMWLGFNWMKYIVMLSGILMSTTLVLQVILIVQQLFFSKKKQVP